MSRNSFTKRTIDLALSIMALPLVLPLCILLMVAIRLESRGSPLFIQERVGRNRAAFRMLKLRTMVVDTDNLPSHEVDSAGITPLGRTLRRFKLDELPQLLNVVAGSMSLVGPRPCLPTQTELIEERLKRGIFAYRPGITGPAQLVGVDMSEPRRVAEIEAAYFAEARAVRDFKLIWQTATGAGHGDAATRP